MERDAVHKALMSLLRQDPKGSLISLQLLCMKMLVLLKNYEANMRKLVNMIFQCYGRYLVFCVLG